jgi:phosphatidylserine/phosphatidylglycerophosphate/cardiolipin synthase-like enzyme
LIELRTFTDGGQRAEDVARDVVAFLGAAERTLDLAIYSIRLTGETGSFVRDALVDAHGRGVRVRFLYNVDHPNPIPVPPPPETQPDLLERLPFATQAVSGIPDLMHHKVVVRDGETLWTGSLNWTNDSWTRQENVAAVVRSPELARAYTLNFEELWNGAPVERSGRVEPRPVKVGEAEVRPWFCPAYGEELAHRIAKQLGRAKRRIRIASPVLTSGPILGTLAEIAGEGRCDLAGIVDDTQCDEVFRQWGAQGVSTWKIPLLRRVLESAPFSGKQSTPWRPDSLHDFMHAKVTVADDIAFVGSFNLSRSGERNAENVLEIHDAAIADRLAAYVDEIRAAYGPATPPA